MEEGSEKYKIKLPFNFFKCVRIAHYSSKFPYGKLENSDDENNIEI